MWNPNQSRHAHRAYIHTVKTEFKNTSFVVWFFFVLLTDLFQIYLEYNTVYCARWTGGEGHFAILTYVPGPSGGGDIFLIFGVRGGPSIILILFIWNLHTYRYQRMWRLPFVYLFLRYKKNSVSVSKQVYYEMNIMTKFGSKFLVYNEAVFFEAIITKQVLQQ